MSKSYCAARNVQHIKAEKITNIVMTKHNAFGDTSCARLHTHNHKHVIYI